MKRILLPCLLLLLAALAGCGGDSKAAPPQVSVVVSPGTANVIAGQTQQFTATVSGNSNTAVTWTVSGTGCSGTSCGTIDANGLYKAPDLIPATITITVTATSVADASRSGSAALTHQCVWVGIFPSSNVSLISADIKQFTATVTHAPTGKDGVTWSVTGGGTVDAAGLYHAPAKVITDTTATLVATSTFDNTKTASVTIALKAPVVTVAPGDVTLEAGGAHQQFIATVTNVPAGQAGVTWSLNGVGTLSVGGLYTTPDLVSDTVTAIIQAVPSFDDSKVGKATVTIHPVAVAVLPKAVSHFAGETQQFTATVANHVNKSVTWEVSGATCAGAACGTVDANGLYLAPSSITSEFTVSVTAASVADTSRSDSATITLKPISVTVSPESVNVQVGTTKQFSATVRGSSNTSVTWAVSGAGCTGNTCGAIDSSGLYTAPATIPVPPTVTITATSVADPSRSDDVTVTVINDPQAKLHGPYAFVYTGWDMSAKALDAIGSIVADGSGHLTGLIDMNGVNTSYRRIAEAFTGTYQVNATDNRGEMVFNLSTGARTFRFAIDSSGDRGHFILFEETGMGLNRYGSGVFKRQTTSDFALDKLSGDYAMGMAGMSAMGDERNALVGRMHLDGAGAISNTSLDITNTGGPSENITFTGGIAMNSTTGIASGRGTMTVTSVPGTVNFSFYLVNAEEAYMIRTDVIGEDTPIFVGGLSRQRGGPYSAAFLTGQSVFYMTGIVKQTIVKAASTVGQFNLSSGVGSSQYTTSGAGSIFSGHSDVTISVDANGRGTFTWATLGGAYIVYLVARNTGFLMQYTNPGSTVNFGFFESQSPGPFDNAYLKGEFFGGAIAPSTSGVDYGNGLQLWDGSGGFTGTGNNAGPSIGLHPDIPVTGTYIITDSTAGAGNWRSTSPGTYNKKFYVVGPNKIVFVPTEPSNVNPAVEMFQK